MSATMQEKLTVIIIFNGILTAKGAKFIKESSHFYPCALEVKLSAINKKKGINKFIPF